MPPEVMPGAIWTPGVLAGYGRGATLMQIALDHFTVGTDSRGVGLRGYFNILFPKEGPPFQYAETNALTWHGAHMNPYGPGAEWERLVAGPMWRAGLVVAEDLTPDQIYWGRHWIDHLEEWGIPREHYVGPRYQWQGFWGNCNHGDVDDQRSDGITDARLGEDTAEWQHLSDVVSPFPDLSFLEEEDMQIFTCADDGFFVRRGKFYLLIPALFLFTEISGPEGFPGVKVTAPLSAAFVDKIVIQVLGLAKSAGLTPANL